MFVPWLGFLVHITWRPRSVGFLVLLGLNFGIDLVSRVSARVRTIFGQEGFCDADGVLGGVVWERLWLVLGEF